MQNEQNELLVMNLINFQAWVMNFLKAKFPPFVKRLRFKSFR